MGCGVVVDAQTGLIEIGNLLAMAALRLEVMSALPLKSS